MATPAPALFEGLTLRAHDEPGIRIRAGENVDWKAVARIFVQVALVAPMMVLYPFALLSVFASFASAGPQELGLGGIFLGFAQLMAVFGLSMLFLSICLSTAALRGQRLRKWVTAGLICGFVATALWQGVMLFESSFSDPVIFNPWNLYAFGGAVFVGAWNLSRAWDKKAEAKADQPVTSSPGS